jgi:hypothetical protein
MRIIEVSVSKKFNLGNYQMLDIGLVASVEASDDESITVLQATKMLNEEIERSAKAIKELNTI